MKNRVGQPNDRCSVGTVLLTGGTGFIGSHVAEALVAGGIRVVALVRPGSEIDGLRALGVPCREGDVLDPPSLARAVAGCRQVVHVAARVGDWGARAEFFRVNVDGTLNVLAAARQAEVEQVVLTGSISSYGEEDNPATKDETWPFRSHHAYWLDRWFPCAINHYRDSKAEATRRAMDYARAQGMNVTILEPAWVYGEREVSTGFYAYLKAVQGGLRCMPGSSRNRFHVIYAGDLGRAFLLAVRRRLPGVERVIVANPEAPRMQDIFTALCRAAGLRRPRRLPRWVLMPAAVVLEGWATVLRQPVPPALTRGRLCTFYDSIQYSPAKARRLLGFQARVPLEEGARRTVSWYQRQGLLTPTQKEA